MEAQASSTFNFHSYDNRDFILLGISLQNIKINENFNKMDSIESSLPFIKKLNQLLKLLKQICFDHIITCTKLAIDNKVERSCLNHLEQTVQTRLTQIIAKQEQNKEESKIIEDLELDSKIYGMKQLREQIEELKNDFEIQMDLMEDLTEQDVVGFDSLFMYLLVKPLKVQDKSLLKEVKPYLVFMINALKHSLNEESIQTIEDMIIKDEPQTNVPQLRLNGSQPTSLHQSQKFQSKRTAIVQTEEDQELEEILQSYYFSSPTFKQLQTYRNSSQRFSLTQNLMSSQQINLPQSFEEKYSDQFNPLAQVAPFKVPGLTQQASSSYPNNNIQTHTQPSQSLSSSQVIQNTNTQQSQNQINEKGKFQKPEFNLKKRDEKLSQKLHAKLKEQHVITTKRQKNVIQQFKLKMFRAIIKNQNFLQQIQRY